MIAQQNSNVSYNSRPKFTQETSWRCVGPLFGRLRLLENLALIGFVREMAWQAQD